MIHPFSQYNCAPKNVFLCAKFHNLCVTLLEAVNETKQLVIMKGVYKLLYDIFHQEIIGFSFVRNTLASNSGTLRIKEEYLHSLYHHLADFLY